MSSQFFIALGSNLGNRIAHIDRAMDILSREEYISDLVASSFYRSEPIDATGGFYINIVASGRTKLSPEQLLAYLLDVEFRCGRKRTGHNSPRTIDIDLLLYENLRMDLDFLTLPHPRMHERAFVMLPLLEVAPSVEIPGIDMKNIEPNYLEQRIEKLHTRNLWKGKYAIMGILNITDDSFYDGGRYVSESQALERVESMLQEGADIIDIGGQSSRPGAISISEEEEISRIEPVLKKIREVFPNVVISIDTYRSGVVDMATKYGVDIINDISAGSLDPYLIEGIATSGCTYVLMHMQGNPSAMQIDPAYQDVTAEIYGFLEEKIGYCKSLGITDIIVDPGFGFGKTIAHNYEILGHLSDLKKLGYPILAGISRKSMIYKPLAITPDEALTGTTALHMTALMNGAEIIRVHDVKAAKQIITLFELYEQHNC